jgi:hypothetical protein
MGPTRTSKGQKGCRVQVGLMIKLKGIKKEW